MTILISYPPRLDDSFLMEKLSTLPVSPQESIRLNQCHIYLCVLTLSDIVDAHASVLLNQGRPSEHDQRFWEESIKRIYIVYSGYNLLHPRGEWKYKSHQIWKWQHDIQRNILYQVHERY